MATSCVHGRSLDDGSPQTIEIENGRIIDIRPCDASEGEDLPYLSPGFFDIQVNGCMGQGYRFPEFDENQLYGIVSRLTASGTARHLPTLATGPQELIVRNLRIIARAASSDADIAAALPGIHIEGPYISSETGPRGAHDPAYIRNPSLEEFDEWQEAADGRVVMVTLAPELDGAIEFIKNLSSRGILVAIGHTAADAETISRAVAAGASFSTHLGNGSHAMLPRHENYIWEQLAEDRLAASIIADGFHLPSSVMKTIWRAKGTPNVVLISDVSKMAGMPPGKYDVSGISVRMHSDGHVSVDGTPYLAGSGHLLDWALLRFIEVCGCSLQAAISTCTENPARMLNMEGESLTIGSPGHLTLFRYRTGDQRLSISSVLRSGKTVYRGD